MERLPIFKGQVVDLGVEKVTLPNGHRMELEVVRHPGAAAIVPLHEDGTITFVHQFRHAGGGMRQGLMYSDSSGEAPTSVSWVARNRKIRSSVKPGVV